MGCFAEVRLLDFPDLILPGKSRLLRLGRIAALAICNSCTPHEAAWLPMVAWLPGCLAAWLPGCLAASVAYLLDA